MTISYQRRRGTYYYYGYQRIDGRLFSAYIGRELSPEAEAKARDTISRKAGCI